MGVPWQHITGLRNIANLCKRRAKKRMQRRTDENGVPLCRSLDQCSPFIASYFAVYSLHQCFLQVVSAAMQPPRVKPVRCYRDAGALGTGLEGGRCPGEVGIAMPSSVVALYSVLLSILQSAFAPH